MGDSVTYGKYTAGSPYWGKQGWSKYLESDINTEALTVNNQSYPGLETEDYIQGFKIDGYVSNPITTTFSEKNLSTWDTIEASLNEGDYVMIALGINDIDHDSKHGTLYDDEELGFVANLRKYVSETLAKEATPILVTPHIPLIDPLTTYDQAAADIRTVAAEYQGVILIDLNADMKETYGDRTYTDLQNDAAINRYYAATCVKDDGTLAFSTDWTHLTEAGAEYVWGRMRTILEEADSDFVTNYLK